MALADWVQYTSSVSGADPVISIDVTTPIVDLGSLRVNHPSAINQAGWNAHLDAPFSKGFTKGRIRTLVQGLETAWSGGRPRASTGIICLQSALDCTTGTPNFYFLGFGSTQTDGWRLALWKMAAKNLQSSSTTEILYQQATGFTVAGDFFPIELEWNVDIPGLGGTRLIARIGTLNSEDFGTLADVYDAVDSTSPFTTSVAEGVASRKGMTQAFVRNWNMDMTTVFELV